MSDPEVPGAAPGAEASALTGEPIPATLARRLACLVYEALLLAAVLFVAALAFLLVVGQATSGGARLAFQIYLLAVGAGYFGWLWSNGRRTLAMRTWRIRLVGPSGHPPGPGRALGRYAAAWIGPAAALAAFAWIGRPGLVLAALNHAWALADPQGRFLHDRIAGTRMVRDSEGARPPLAPRAGRPGR